MSNQSVAYAHMHQRPSVSLGMVNFVRRYVKDYAEITAPLVLLTGEDYACPEKPF